MPDLFLNLLHIRYVSDRNISVDAWRAHAEVLFEAQSGAQVSFSCILDSGAPFSVLPFSLWNGRNLKWTFLGSQLTPSGSPVPEALDWQSVPCDLGETSVHLVDGQNRLQAGPFLVVAKFPRQRLPRTNLETIAV